MADKNCSYCKGRGGYSFGVPAIHCTCTHCQKTHVYKAWMSHKKTHDTFRIQSPRTKVKLSIPSGYWDRLPEYLRGQLEDWRDKYDKAIVLSVEDAKLLMKIDEEYRHHLYNEDFDPYVRLPYLQKG